MDQGCRASAADVGRVRTGAGIGEKLLGWLGKELRIAEVTLPARTPNGYLYTPNISYDPS